MSSLQTANKCLQCAKPAHSWCSGCCEAYYCSRECQVQHWKSFHKFECVRKRKKQKNSNMKKKPKHKQKHDKNTTNQKNIDRDHDQQNRQQNSDPSTNNTTVSAESLVLRLRSLIPNTNLISTSKPQFEATDITRIFQFIDVCPPFTFTKQGTNEIVDSTMAKGNDLAIDHLTVQHAVLNNICPFLMSNRDFVTNTNIRDGLWDMILSMLKDKKYLVRMSFVGVAVIDSCIQCKSQRDQDGIESFFTLVKQSNAHIFCVWTCEFLSQYVTRVMDRDRLKQERKDGTYGLFCAFCKRRENGAKFEVCERCKDTDRTTVAYCSRRCQKKDWSRHKKNCLKT